MSVGKSVRLFLADGTPGGLLTAEIMNWTGHVVAAPRSDLAALLKRTETSRTGICILLGDDPDSLGGQLAYIGEGDDISKRDGWAIPRRRPHCDISTLPRAATTKSRRCGARRWRRVRYLLSI